MRIPSQDQNTAPRRYPSARLRGKGALCVLVIAALTAPMPAAAADKFTVPACEGVPAEVFGFQDNYLRKRKDLPDLAKLMKAHRGFLSHFMNHYHRASLPTVVLTPTLELDKLDFLQLTGAPIPNFNQLRMTARTISVLGDYFRLTGEPRRAATVYRAIFTFGIDIGHGFGTVKTLINHMISIAVQKVSLVRLIDLFGRRALSSREESGVLRAIDRLMNQRVGLAESFRCERATIEKLDFKEIARQSFGTKTLNRSLWNRLVLKLFHGRATRHLHRMGGEIYDSMEKGLSLPYREGQVHFDRAEKMVKEQSAKAHSIVGMVFSPAKTMARFMIAIMIPNCNRAWVQELAVPTLRNGLYLMHLLNEYRRATGAYPADLAQLADASKTTLPLDLYTGKSLIYKRDDESFILYSPGGDMQDDGGNRGDDVLIYLTVQDQRADGGS